MGAIGGSLVGLVYSFVFLYEATEGRATKAAYPHGTLNEVRNERQTERALRRAAADSTAPAITGDSTCDPLVPSTVPRRFRRPTSLGNAGQAVRWWPNTSWLPGAGEALVAGDDH
jgi:hypothetical protein